MTLVLRLCLGVLLLTPGLTHAAVLEIPGPGANLSGIGVISGWKCEAEGAITVRLDGGPPLPLLYGSERGDTHGACGDTNNGFVAIWNWAELGAGSHTAIASDDGVEFAQSTFTVATLGEPFVQGASGACTLADFPAPGERATFAWNQATQHLELVGAGSGPAAAPLQTHSSHAAALEIPGPGANLSGIGVISGWKCEAEGAITVRLDGGPPLPLLYGSERGDTHGVCGDTNNGFVAIWNWAKLGAGSHTAIASDDGVEFAQSTFTVATLGEPFVQGASGGCTLADFPAPGENATFAWNQATQHLELAMSERASALDLPLRALHVGTNYNGAPTNLTVEQWEAAGRVGPLIPPDYIARLQRLHVNWIGLSVALHYDDSMDSTVERVTSSDVLVPTYSDATLRQLLREFRSHGINVYLTSAFEAAEAETAGRPLYRYDLGDPGFPGMVPYGSEIKPEFWPWRPSHPDHQRFVAEFWETYTQQAVHFARIAEEEGVRLYSLGTETERLFRTRSGGERWPNHFRAELQEMVRRVRAVYSGLLTYAMHHSALTDADYFGPGSNHLWEDLDLDIVGISAYFPLIDYRPTTVLSVAELQAGSERVFQNYLLPLVERNPDRPLIFLEDGAPGMIEAPQKPAPLPGQMFVFTDTNGNGLDDGRETQANMFQALFNTMAQHPGVLNGVFFWDNYIGSDALLGDSTARFRSYSIWDKPSEEVVRSAYEGYKNR